MNKEQARLFFPHSPEDDLEDLWEQRLFEQKQFFLTHPPIRKVWKARLNRLTQQYKAYSILIQQPEEEVTNDIILINENLFPNDFIAAFHAFHALRNQYKAKLLQAQTLNEINNIVHQWLNTEWQFAKHWSLPESEHHEIEVIRSKEPDPMELLKALKDTEKTIQSSSLSILKENYNNLNESIQKEVKRLTLL